MTAMLQSTRLAGCPCCERRSPHLHRTLKRRERQAWKREVSQ